MQEEQITFIVIIVLTIPALTLSIALLIDAYRQEKRGKYGIK